MGAVSQPAAVQTTLVVHVHDPRFAENPDAVYIGRKAVRAADPRCRKASFWKNPYTARVGRGPSRAHVIAEYERMLREWLRLGHITPSRLLDLDGKVLGCWCKVEGHEACHGDVIVKLIAEIKGAHR